MAFGIFHYFLAACDYGSDTEFSCSSESAFVDLWFEGVLF